MKPTICKVCKTEFTKQRMGQKVCGPECAQTLGTSKNAKALKVEITRARRAAKEKLKTRQDWLREVQGVFNKFIRLRDADQPCISCGRHHQGQYHAGHFLSIGSHPELRFSEINVHKQCQPCNTHLSGNALEYRKGLIARVGLDPLDWLEGPHGVKKYTIIELMEIKDIYRKKLKELKNGDPSC